MTYETDPTRWTSDPESAPASLREPLEAAGREAPSSAQLSALAVKLAAVAAAGSVAAGAASTAHASSDGLGAFASASTASGSKLMLALTFGAAALGGAAWWAANPTPAENTERGRVTQPAAQVAAEPAAGHSSSPAAMPARATARMAGPVRVAPSMQDESELPREEKAAPSAGGAAQLAENEGRTTRAETRQPPVTPAAHTPRLARRSGAKKARAKAATPESVSAHNPTAPSSAPAAESIVAKTVPPSEVELLRRARAALALNPLDTVALTEAHREYYPRGVFAQERDALAIEALMRAGNMARARTLAEQFVSAHPNSPHAHRFREAMGLH